MARMLIIGLDGADPALAAPWMEDGTLPNLHALARAGTLLPLRSTMPPATFPAWTTCATGVNPGRHGVFDFTDMPPGGYALRFVNRTFRRVPAVWNTLSDAGARVGVLGVPGTYPPEQVNGFMVSGFDSPVATSIDRSFVYPPEYHDDVQGWRFADFQEHNTGPGWRERVGTLLRMQGRRDACGTGGWHERARARLLAKIADKEAAALRLLRREPWDFFMAVFGETDTVSHHFWRFHDPHSPRHEADPVLSNAVREVYARLDTTVGRMVEASCAEHVLIVSDHGFMGAGTGVIHLNNFLAERGLLRFSGGNESALKSMALRFAPERARGALFRRFTGLAAGAETRSRFGGIDWSATRAYSEELDYFPSIRVNLAGREPQGIVRPEDYDAFVAELCAALEAWGPIARALPRASVYDGPHVDRAPDILIEPALENGYRPACLRARGGPSFRRMDPAEYAGGKERGMNGVHRSPGLLVSNTPVTKPDPGLEDIAPTALSALGGAGPPMDGRPLWGAAPNGSLPAGPVAPEESMSEADEAELAARLRVLGYLE